MAFARRLNVFGAGVGNWSEIQGFFPWILDNQVFSAVFLFVFDLGFIFLLKRSIRPPLAPSFCTDPSPAPCIDSRGT